MKYVLIKIGLKIDKFLMLVAPPVHNVHNYFLTLIYYFNLFLNALVNKH